MLIKLHFLFLHILVILIHSEHVGPLGGSPALITGYIYVNVPSGLAWNKMLNN